MEISSLFGNKLVERAISEIMLITDSGRARIPLVMHCRLHIISIKSPLSNGFFKRGARWMAMSPGLYPGTFFVACATKAAKSQTQVFWWVRVSCLQISLGTQCLFCNVQEPAVKKLMLMAVVWCLGAQSEAHKKKTVRYPRVLSSIYIDHLANMEVPASTILGHFLENRFFQVISLRNGCWIFSV